MGQGKVVLDRMVGCGNVHRGTERVERGEGSFTCLHVVSDPLRCIAVAMPLCRDIIQAGD